MKEPTMNNNELTALITSVILSIIWGVASDGLIQNEMFAVIGYCIILSVCFNLSKPSFSLKLLVRFFLVAIGVVFTFLFFVLLTIGVHGLDLPKVISWLLLIITYILANLFLLVSQGDVMINRKFFILLMIEAGILWGVTVISNHNYSVQLWMSIWVICSIIIVILMKDRGVSDS